MYTSPGHSQMLETWHPQPSSWRSFWHHQVPWSGKVLSLVAIYFIWCRRNGQQMLNIRHTPSRVKGTPSSFILPRSSMGMPQDGPPWVQWQDLPGHQWLLFQMGWDEAPCQADQHRDYPPDKECIAAHRLPDIIVTDSGIQFSSQDFADFASS